MSMVENMREEREREREREGERERERDLERLCPALGEGVSPNTLTLRQCQGPFTPPAVSRT